MAQHLCAPSPARLRTRNDLRRPRVRREWLFAARVLEATVGTLYRFRLDGDPQAYPDPASRFQPQGPHGPSALIDPTSFEWPDSGWKGLRLALDFRSHDASVSRVNGDAYKVVANNDRYE